MDILEAHESFIKELSLETPPWDALLLLDPSSSLAHMLTVEFGGEEEFNFASLTSTVEGTMVGEGPPGALAGWRL